LNQTNFIVSTKCVVVDWECARFAGIEWDLAHFVARTTTAWGGGAPLSAEQVETFLRTYTECAATHSLTAVCDAVNRILPFIYFRCFAWCLGTYAQHVSGVIPPLQETHLGAVRQYLSADFMAECLDITKHER
jgi:thiamine kinase-like enzyme